MAKYFVNVNVVEFIDMDGNIVYKHTRKAGSDNIEEINVVNSYCKGCACDSNKEENISCCYCNNGHLYTKKSEEVTT